MSSRNRNRLLVGATLLVPSLVLFWEVLFRGRVLFWGVPLLQFGPWYEAAREALRAAQLPLWNPLLGNGAPLLANYQSAIFYPPNWLHLVLAPARAMSWLMILHVVWAGLGMWMYVGRIGLRGWSRLVSALSFMLSGYLVSRLGFPSMGSTLPWLPWLLWAAERVVREHSLRAAVVLGVCLSMQWLAGHAQIAFYSGLALCGYLVWRIGSPSPPATDVSGSRKSAVGRVLACLLVAAAIGIGLAAVQLLPTAELQRLSQRASGVDYDFAMHYSLWPPRLIGFLMPRFFGHPATGNYWGYCCNYWEDSGYVGTLPLLLAGSAVVGWIGARRKRVSPVSFADGRPISVAESLVPFYACLGLFAVLLALGNHTPLYPFFHEYVPGFGLFQAPARLLCLWTLSASVLAGIGAEHWQPTDTIKKVTRYGIVVGLGLLVAAGGSTAALTGRTLTFVAGLLQLGLVLILVGLLVVRQPHSSESRASIRWSGAVALLIAADLVSVNWGVNPTAEPWLYTKPTASAAALRAAGLTGRTFISSDERDAVTFDRYLSFSSFSPIQGAPWFSMRETLLPNMGVLDGLSSANNYDPLLPIRYAELLDAVDSAEPALELRLLQMMGVETLITREDRPGLTTVYSNGDVTFSAIPSPLPRAYLVYHARWVAGREEALEAVVDPGFDPAFEVVVEGFPAEGGSPAIWQPVVLTTSRNVVTIRAALPRDGYLVLLDTYYPGWHARVDGEPQAILPANLAFRAVQLPAGEHVVEFRYRPLTFLGGAAITGVTLVGVLVALAYQHVRVRRKGQGGV